MMADGRRTLRLSETGAPAMPVLDERTEAGTSTHSSAEPDSPRPARRRLSQIGGDRPTAGGRRGSHAPELEAIALLRERFLHHLVTQVKLSNVVRVFAPLLCAPPCLIPPHADAHARHARLRHLRRR
jgi:hypothetical protein